MKYEVDNNKIQCYFNTELNALKGLNKVQVAEFNKNVEVIEKIAKDGDITINT